MTQDFRTLQCKASLRLGSALAAVVASSLIVVTPALAKSDPEPAQSNASEQGAAKDAAASSEGDASTSAGGNAADIIVTGSRVARDGFRAPSPTTVLSSEQLTLTAPANIADAVNQLPAVAVGGNPRVGNGSSSSGLGGLNLLNLRNLGTARTLVLLDGRRVVGSTSAGLVNVNSFPQQLIERVDVVTGGASAAYGSDAVAGVVNFILNKDFTGFATDATAGVSDRGDGGVRRFSASYGTRFADGRGHLLISGEYSDVDGVFDVESRDWFKGTKLVSNPSATGPRRIYADHVNISTASWGGLITQDPANGPLAGIQFGPGGVTSPFQFGQLLPGSPNQMIGGQYNDLGANSAISSDLRDRNIYGRVSFDVTPDVTIFGEGSYGKSESRADSIYQFKLGTLRIQRDNAFLPDSIRTQMVNAGLTELRFGTLNRDIGKLRIHNDYETYRGVLGLSADLGGSWRADAYYQYGRTNGHNYVDNETITARYNQAIDAIRDASGNIVCRNPAGGCVPLNVLGEGVASQAAIDWVTDRSERFSKIQQHVAAVTINGEPFSTWAGPVSVSFGGEYRSESTRERSDPLSLVSGYFSGNFKPTNGSYNVKEAFFETVVPLAENLPFARSLELNAAIRGTDYSTTGYVTTWKVGGTWRPINDLMLRAVRSRDIRAPNIADLFAQASAVFIVTDPFNGNRSDTIQGFFISGNPNLTPEVSSNLTFGAVYTPSWLPGFSVSFDAYDIKIDKYITSIASSVQQAVNLCFAGSSAACSLVTRDAGGRISTVRLAGVNAGKLETSGFDIEAAYRKDLSDWSSSLGTLSIRALASRLNKLTIDTSLASRDFAGEVSQQNTPNFAYYPKWRGSLTVTYEQGPATLAVIGRYIGPGTVDNTYTANDIVSNRVSPVTYVDASLTFRVKDVPGEPEFYMAVDNLFDRDPPTVNQYNFPLGSGTSIGFYDAIGRNYRVGFRTKF